MGRKHNLAEQAEPELPQSDTNGHAESPNAAQKREPGKEALQRKLAGFQERLSLMQQTNEIIYTAGTDRSGQADKLIDLGWSPTEVAGILEAKKYTLQDGSSKWRAGFSYDDINAMKQNVKVYTDMLEKYEPRKNNFVAREEERRAAHQQEGQERF